MDLLQRIKGILPELGTRSQVADQETDRRATEGILQYPSQFRVSIWYAALLRWECKGQATTASGHHAPRLD